MKTRKVNWIVTKHVIPLCRQRQ
ncbi:hypothetical protein KSF78_0009754 [Schistosoma japonicum]|nr:hypothetical protein KSF78_0009754 [Schistosoma japonicum]